MESFPEAQALEKSALLLVILIGQATVRFRSKRGTCYQCFFGWAQKRSCTFLHAFAAFFRVCKGLRTAKARALNVENMATRAIQV